MATAIEILARALVEDARLELLYDDLTLRGTGVRVVAPPTLQKNCQAVIELADGNVLSRIVTPAQYNTIFNIPSGQRPQGTFETNQFGLAFVRWPINKSALLF